MKRTILTVLAMLFALLSFAQIIKQNEQFESVPVVGNKVVFLKEVTISKSISDLDNYQVLKEWARENYGKDPFVSSVRYDARKHEIIAKSRVELVLPANEMGIREKMIMRFRVNGFLHQDKCVLEVTDISFLHENAKDKRLPRVIRAEDFITDQMLSTADDLQQLRVNTKKSTLYFLNELGKDFEKMFGY